MQNIAPKRIVSRRTNQLLTLAFLAAAIGIFLIALAIFMFAVPLDRPQYPSFSLYAAARTIFLGLGALSLIAAAGLTIRGLTYRRDNDLALLTGRVLEPMLDHRFTFIRNLNKREIGYVDAVLIGPPGLLVLRIVGLTGAYVNDGVNWLRRDQRGDWKPARYSPTEQALADIRKLQQFLGKRGHAGVPVFGMVVFTPDPSRVALQSKNPMLPITHLAALMPSLQGYLSAPPIDAERLGAITRDLLS